MRKFVIAATAAVALSFALSAAAPAWAADDPPKSDAKKDSDKKDAPDLPPFPADALLARPGFGWRYFERRHYSLHSSAASLPAPQR